MCETWLVVLEHKEINVAPSTLENVREVQETYRTLVFSTNYNKMKKRNLLLFIILLLKVIFENGIYAQSPMQVVQPSPQVSSLFKYVEYPVDFLTGLPQISIPLYEVKSGSISLPITLNYHSSGRKVYDETGAVGLGWTLMSGGTISRSVYGDPDDNEALATFPVPWNSHSQINQSTDAGILFLGKVMNEAGGMPWYDTEYDIFSYFVNGISGKFALRDINNIKYPVLLPKKPYKIQTHHHDGPFNDNYFDYIDLTDDKGVLYHFSAIETSNTEMSNGSGSVYTPVTAWQLTTIISANKSDTITLKYKSFSKQRRRPIQITTIIDGWVACPCNVCGNPYSEPFPDPNVTTDELTALDQYDIQRLTEIDFASGKVVFNLQSGSDIIQSMQVFDNNGNNIKSVIFSSTDLDRLSEGNSSTKKLDFITIQGLNSSEIEKYTFDYYPTKYATGSNWINARYQDFWGYYNASGVSNMRPLVTGVLVGNSIGLKSPMNIGFSSRGADLAATESGVLKLITYPTGGNSEFTYELNQYSDQTVIKNSGGLRLTQIKTFDGQNYMYKTYKYGLKECGYGYLPFIPDGAKNLVSTGIIKYEEAGGGVTVARVSYSQRIYSSEVNPLFSYIATKPVIYSQVTEYLGLGNNTIGKTVYSYDNDDVMAPTNLLSVMQTIAFNYCKNSSLIEKDDYKNTSPPGSSPNYKLVKKLVNFYSLTYYDSEDLKGLRVQQRISASPSSVTDNITGNQIPSYQFAATRTAPCGSGGSGVGPMNVFDYGDYSLYVAKKEFTGSKDTIFTDAGNISTTIGYMYNTNHLLSKKTLVSSNNENITTDINYPFDYSGNTVLSQMITLNMLNFPVEQIEKKDNTFLQSTKTSYDFFQRNTSNIAPSRVDVTIGTGTSETRLRYYDYDEKGNILSLSKENDVLQNYIWGYNQTLPVVKAENIDYTTLYRAFLSALSTAQIINFSEITVPSLNSGQKAKLKAFNTALQGNAGFSKSMISTYTYKPLVGMTSSTTPDGVTTYYEYDTFGRLQYIKDDDGRILKSYEYHYKP